MKLWIRSQDKTILLKCENAFLDDLDETEIRTKEFIIGQYKSKERALEVLDEIQKLLQPQMILSKVGKPIAETCEGTVYVNPDEYEIKEISTYVYEMPQE